MPNKFRALGSRGEAAMWGCGAHSATAGQSTQMLKLANTSEQIERPLLVMNMMAVAILRKMRQSRLKEIAFS
jgi:hypothetical protein